MWEKHLCRHQGQWRRRGRRCSRHWSRGSPAACGEDYGEAGCPPAAHGGPWCSRYPPAACRIPHTRAGGCLKEGVTPWWAHTTAGFWKDLWTHGAHTAAGLLAGLVIPWGTHAGAVCSWKTARHGRDPCWSSSWRTAACGKDSHWRSLWWRSVVGGATHWSRGGVWGGRSSRENKWWIDCNPHSPSHCATSGEEAENTGVKLSPEKREGWGKNILRFGFISDCPALIWLVIY